MAAPTDDPLKQLLEWFVFAPAGLLLEARRLYPSIVESGRQHVDNQVKLARFVGEFAVQQGRMFAEHRIQGFLHLQPAPSSATATTETAAVERPVIEPPTGVTSDEIAIESLAIDNYATLAASQIVGRLVGLSRHDLDIVGRYEAAHRSRRTILSQIARLRPGAL